MVLYNFGNNFVPLDDKGIELGNGIHRLRCLSYRIDIDGDSEEF